MPDGGIPAQEMERRAAELQRLHPDFSVLALMIQTAVENGLASDSRGLASGLDSEHALVLREIETLSACGLLVITGRNIRTMRTQVRAAADQLETASP